ncbi:hypothetical protein AGR4A_Cc210124 [Agrobacterium tumefaciens str. B6]|uniref:Uncharacterized protein n=1 Tax=Agrobacterium tumefaciens str. B6 TaxID=1183423 RepID=A0A822V0G2_AGRTU|nr:hypothetical protein AGR4A_Cc210124 [Agrobacterium tumefaciens str. B6]
MRTMLPACQGRRKNSSQIGPLRQNYGGFVCFALAKSVNILRSNRVTRFLNAAVVSRTMGRSLSWIKS